MLRSRIIKPGFFTNDVLSELEPLCRLLFIGLWCMADREGRIIYRPKKIKIEILPYDDCNIENYIKILSDKKFIFLYKPQKSEEILIQINNWHKHQHLHPREAESTLSAFTSTDTYTFTSTSTYTYTAQPCKTDASTLHQSCMNDASLMQEPCVKNQAPPLSAVADDIYKNKIPVVKFVKSKKLKKSYIEEFERNWDIYPHRVDDNKEKGRKKWEEKINEGEAIENLSSSVINYKKYTEINSIEEQFLIKFSNFIENNDYKSFIAPNFDQLKQKKGALYEKNNRFNKETPAARAQRETNEFADKKLRECFGIGKKDN